MHTNEVDYLTVYYYIAIAFSVFNMIYNIDALYYVIVYTSCSMCKISGRFSPSICTKLFIATVT